MRGIVRWSFALVALLLVFRNAAAQEAPAPERWPRWEAAVLAGYRFEGTLHPLGDVDVPRIEVDNTVTFAFSLGYNLNPVFETEINYSYASAPATPVSGAPGGAGSGFDIGMHEFQAGIMAHLAEPSAAVRPYFELLLGATVLNTTGNVGETVKFTPGISLGVKGYPSDHFGWRAEAHYTPMFLYNTGNGTELCFDYGGCWNTGDRYLQQVDVRAGATFRF